MKPRRSCDSSCRFLRVASGLGSTFAAPSELPPSEQLTPYIDTARELFIAFFVENVILDIHGEDEI